MAENPFAELQCPHDDDDCPDCRLDDHCETRGYRQGVTDALRAAFVAIEAANKRFLSSMENRCEDALEYVKAQAQEAGFELPAAAAASQGPQPTPRQKER